MAYEGTLSHHCKFRALKLRNTAYSGKNALSTLLLHCEFSATFAVKICVPNYTPGSLVMAHSSLAVAKVAETSQWSSKVDNAGNHVFAAAPCISQF